jgi:hypothetical protein
MFLHLWPSWRAAQILTDARRQSSLCEGLTIHEYFDISDWLKIVKDWGIDE